ncbi:hypothetical protein AWZ03_001555 [Drosophila navojoa]|uniref:Kazal-like domain-containing protein n=1 Tax=Drosophila navojoa TaxID=7232 RepID=A0A484BVD3_DRONA|nr:hypothetical protein AWZ03_001555 [Drosophila navojoa]
MKSATLLLLIVVGICALSSASRPRRNCPTICTQDYKPVCAIWARGRLLSRCTFSNSCALSRQQCVTKDDWIQFHAGKCRRQTRDCSRLLRI